MNSIIKKQFSNKISKEIFKGAATAFILKVLAAAVSLCLNVMLARLLGAEKSGIYFLSLSIITIAATIGQCGFGGSLVRFIAGYSSSMEWEKIDGIYKKVIFFSTTGASMLSLTIFYAAPWLAFKVFSKPELVAPLRWMSIAIVPYSVAMLHAYALQGLKKVGYSITVLSVIIPLASLLSGFFLIRKFDLIGAVWAFIGATLAALFLGLFLWKKSRNNFPLRKGNFSTTILLKSSSPLLVVIIMQLIVSWSGVFFLGIWETSSNLAIFQIANRISSLITFILIAVNNIAAPNFSNYCQKNDIQSLIHTIRNATWLMIFFSLPLLSLFCLFPSFILSIFGNEFVCGDKILIILSIGQFINVAAGSVGQLLIMSGKEYHLQKAFFITAILNIVLSIFLIKFYGILGAALSTALSIIFVNILSLYYCKKELNINPISILFR